MISKRRKIRELAMQTLFVWDTHESATDQDRTELFQQLALDASDEEEVRQTAHVMAAGTWEQRKQIDERVERFAPQWPPRRQPGVDRNLIRLAVWEMMNSPTPPKVVIDEAIELAKHFSTENSPSFINGVLDAILKEHQTLIKSPNDEIRIPE